MGTLSSKAAVFLFSLFVILTVTIAMRRSQTTGAKADGVQYEAIVEPDIAYGSQTKQRLDLCRPKNAIGKHGGVMIIHGGGGDKSQHRDQCKSFAERGLVAIAGNCREADHRYPCGSGQLAIDRNGPSNVRIVRLRITR